MGVRGWLQQQVLLKQAINRQVQRRLVTVIP